MNEIFMINEVSVESIFVMILRKEGFPVFDSLSNPSWAVQIFLNMEFAAN